MSAHAKARRIDVLAALDAAINSSRPGHVLDQIELQAARDAAKEFRDAAVEFYAGLQAMVLCQTQAAPADITTAVNERTARACERFDTALLRFDGGAP